VATTLASDLIATVSRWCPGDAEGRLRRLAWRSMAADEQLLARTGEPAHFTASALPLDETGSRVCLVLHGRIGRWVQPGGHFEASDRKVAEAAAREMVEETGLRGVVDPVPLLLSAHGAPCGTGDWHLDVQMLAVVPRTEPVLSEESLDVAWFPVDELPVEVASGVPDLVAAAVERFSRSGPREPTRLSG
jgi:8-oxo-dGTP pyrophosphatase MutT (NUDIX family)